MADGSANQGALKGIDPEPFLRQIQSGKSLAQVAKQLKVSHQAIQTWMLREVGEQYHEAITSALVSRVVEADNMLRSAKDAVEVTRAREIARFARMDLERRRPALYGQRQQITHEVGEDLGQLLRDARLRVAPASLPDNSQVIDVTPQSDE
jgi:transposase-like protein